MNSTKRYITLVKWNSTIWFFKYYTVCLIRIFTRGHLIETDRKGLVAGYAGQTAIKTDEMIQAKFFLSSFLEILFASFLFFVFFCAVSCAGSCAAFCVVVWKVFSGGDADINKTYISGLDSRIMFQN